MKIQQLLFKILRKQNVTDGRTHARTDNVKTVYPPQTKFAGGIKNFLWLSLGSYQYWARRVYDLCVYFMMGASEGLTESGSGEAKNPKPILTNIISLPLGEPSDQGLFIHCFAFPKLNIIQPNIIK